MAITNPIASTANMNQNSQVKSLRIAVCPSVFFVALVLFLASFGNAFTDLLQVLLPLPIETGFVSLIRRIRVSHPAAILLYIIRIVSHSQFPFDYNCFASSGGWFLAVPTVGAGSVLE